MIHCEEINKTLINKKKNKIRKLQIEKVNIIKNSKNVKYNQ